MTSSVRRGDQKEDRYSIRVLNRALGVLWALSDGRPRTLTELSSELDLSASTTFRLLATLSGHNYVTRDAGSGQYRLGLRCLELARAYHEASDLRRIALPEMEALRDDTTETVHLAILDQMEVVYLEKLPGLHAIGMMASRVGGRLPAYCTGVGKVLLAYHDASEVRAHFAQAGLHRFTATTVGNVDELLACLPQIRSQGYALDHGEHEAEVCCVAAPVFEGTGAIVAAISVSGPGARMEPLEDNRELLGRVRHAATAISTKLGWRLSRPSFHFQEP